MAPFSLPAPSIIPLRLPIFGGPKSIDTNTKLQLLCETFLEYEIFYTLDGTKPQPYAGIVQGNKTIKYLSPFCLPPGKIMIKAIAINANIHTMCSSIVTKCFEVLKVGSLLSTEKKRPLKSKQENCDIRVEGSKKSNSQERTCAMNKFNSKKVDCNENNVDCFENAFLDTVELDFDDCTIEEAIDYKSSFTSDMLDEDVSDNSGYLNETECGKSFSNLSGFAKLDSVHSAQSSFEAHEKAAMKSDEEYAKSDDEENEKSDDEENAKSDEEKAMTVQDATPNIYSQNEDTQFCCMKCDMTLQQCFTCKRMNAVSSKFCIECGSQLIRVCVYCNQHNPCIATFCQFCGKKLLNAAIKLDIFPKVDRCVMAKPKLKNAGIQKLPAVVDKYTQTSSDKSFTKKTPSKYEKKELPPHSPGRGYWHLQLDYICNHLKSHAYNNVEFRKTISEPTLCNFKSAHITKDEENVTVTVVFSPLSLDKCNLSGSCEIGSKGSL